MGPNGHTQVSPRPRAAECPSEDHSEARPATHSCVPSLSWGLPVAGSTSRVYGGYMEPKPRLRKRGTSCALPRSLTHLQLFCFKTSSAHHAGVGAGSRPLTAMSLALVVCEWKIKLLGRAAYSLSEGVWGLRELSSWQFRDMWFPQKCHDRPGTRDL